jgi:hypothetical protein
MWSDVIMLPVINTDVIDVEVALQSIAPAKQAPAAGRNTHHFRASSGALESIDQGYPLHITDPMQRC